MAKRPCADAAVIPVLNCSLSCSPLSAGMLARLLAADDPLPHAYSTACVQLCGHVTVMCSSFSGKADFLLLLQTLNSVEQLVATGTDRVCVEEVAMSCVEWLHCLECYVHRYLVKPATADRTASSCKQAKEVMKWLRTTVDHLETLQDLLIANRQQSCDCHVTMLSLHIHWTAVSVTFRLAPLVGWTWFLEQARLTLSSLLSHSASLSPSPSLPGCHCSTQLWLLLRHTLDHTATATANTATSFWGVVSSLISETITPSQQCPSHDSPGVAVISPSNALIFSWQSVEQLALLYGFSEEGVWESGREMVPHWDLIHHLLPLTFTPGCSEEQLRCALRVSVCLCGKWPSSSLPVLSAWDYFHKHMDDPFVNTARTISEWATPEGSSPQQWLQYLLSLFHSSTTEPHPPDNEANSFQLFLCLIHVTIATDSEGKIWRHLKGRFYSKLHRRWLCERKGAGLRRVLSLLLTLAWTGDAQEVALKAISLLGQMGLGEAGENTALLWRSTHTLCHLLAGLLAPSPPGVCAMILLLVEKRERLDDVINKLQPTLTSLAKPHPPESCDHQRKALGVVLEATVDVMETTNGLSLGGGALIGSHLSDLLTSTDGGHMTRVLSCVESLITVLTPTAFLPPSPHTTSACLLLWKHCSQPLLALTHLPLPPSSLPSTLAALTALTCHQQHINTPPLTIFHELTNDRVHSMLASDYLSHVIESDVIRHHILTTDNSQLLALHVWFRCLAELDHTPSATPTSHSTAVQQLTYQLHKLPMVTALLGNQNTAPTDPLSMLRRLLEAMEASHMRQDEGGAEWRSRLARVLGDLPRYLELSVSGARGVPAVRHAYHVAGLVVSKAPRLTYSRTDSRCLLPRLVDWLVLPLSSSRKPQGQGAAAATRAHLHLFLAGLLQLEPARDNFIHRKVKQLFSRYFHECCQPVSPLLPSSHNPFLLALRPWFQPSCHGDGEELRLVMDVIVCQYLSLPQQPASLTPTLQFIKNVVESVQSLLLLATLTPLLLGHMMSCLLACDVCPAGTEPPAIRRLVLSILTPLATACSEHQDTLPCSSLLPLVSDFVRTNLSVDEALLSKPLLSLGNLYPELLQQLISLLENDVDSRVQSLGHTLQTGLKSL